MKGVDTMAFYRICPDCGAYLDPGEQCSCHEECLIEMERKEKATAFVEKMMKEEKKWPASPGSIGGKDADSKRS
jgi:predicted nucleic acid-binding Zn ribbon protein